MVNDDGYGGDDKESQLEWWITRKRSIIWCIITILLLDAIIIIIVIIIWCIITILLQDAIVIIIRTIIIITAILAPKIKFRHLATGLEIDIFTCSLARLVNIYCLYTSIDQL